MATVDSLEIQIQSTVDEVNKSLDNLISRLGFVTKGLSAIKTNNGLDEFAEKAELVAKSMESVGVKAKDMEKAIDAPMKKASKSLDEMNEQYKNLGKGFQFFGDAQSVQRKITSISNALETAKMKKEELEAAGKTEGAMYENAVSDVIKYKNMLASLQKQLEDMKSVQKPQTEIKIHGLYEAEKTLNDFENQLIKFDNIVESGGEKTAFGIEFPVRGLEMSLEQLKEMYPDAKDLISSYEAEIERAKSLSSNASFMEYGQIDLTPFEQIQNKTKETSERLKEFEANLSKLEIPEIKEKNLDKLQINLEKTEIKLEELRTKLLNGLTMGRITESVDDTGFRNLNEQIALAEKTAGALREKIQGIGNLSGFEKIKKNASQMNNAFSSAGTSIKKVTSGISGFISKISNLSKRINKVTSSSNKMNGSFSNGLKTILKYGFGIRSLYILFNKLRNSIKDGMENLVQYSDRANSSMSILSNSVNQFKNASAAAIAPLLNAFAPAINQIVQSCIKATNAVNQLLAALTGQSTWIKATELSDDYAESVSGTAEATEAALNGIGQFDKLNVINTSKGSGNGTNETNPSDMFKTEEVSTDIQNLADMIKKAWEKADFTDIGTAIGEKISDALDSIDWEKIQTNANKLGKSLATLINGVIEFPDLADKLGKSIGEAINIFITGISGFIENLHWDSIGTFIGELIGSSIDTIKWDEIIDLSGNLGEGLATAANNLVNTDVLSKIAEAIANLIKSAVNVAWSFVTTFDFSNLGTKIGESINTFFTEMNDVDKKTGLTGWQKLGKTISGTISGIATSITKALETVDWVGIGQSIADFISSVDFGKVTWDLTKMVSSLASAISDSIVGFTETSPIGAAIVAMIVGAKLAGLDKKLGSAISALLTTAIIPITGTASVSIGTAVIASVATWEIGFSVGKEIGKAFTGEEDLYNDFSWFGEGGFFDTVFSGDISDDIKIWSDAIKQMGEDLKKWFKEKAISLGIKIPEFVKPIKEKYEEAKKWIAKKIISISFKIASIKDKIKEKWENAKTWISKKIIDIAFSIGSIKEKLSEKWEAAKKWLLDKAFSIAFSVESIKDKLSEKWQTAYEWIKNKALSIGISLPTWDSIKNKISGILRNIIDFINKNLIGKFNSAFKITIPKAAEKIAKAVGIKINSGSVQLFSIPSIPRFNTGGFVSNNGMMKNYSLAGYPSTGSLFWAGDGVPELVGHAPGGTEILNESQIAQSIAAGVESANAAQISYIRQQNEILRQQNQILSGILAKSGISTKEIYSAVKKEDRAYYNINGHSSFSY